MSSMHRKISSLVLLGLVGLAAPAQCQDGSDWDRARAALLASAPGTMSGAIARWNQLEATPSASFDDYAGFTLAWPGFPEQWKLQLAAEHALALAHPDPARIVAYFDRLPPMTNPARAQYALALAALGRPEATDMARAAWRGGSMSDLAESAILARWGSRFTMADQDARVDALLWDGNTAQASRVVALTSPAARPRLLARIALQQGGGTAPAPTNGNGNLLNPNTTPPLSGQGSGMGGSQEGAAGGTTRPVPDANGMISMPVVQAVPAGADSLGAPIPPAITGQPAPALPVLTPEQAAQFLSDPGYVYDRARALTRRGDIYGAATLLGSHPALTGPATDPRKWVALHLAVARAVDPANAMRVAEGAQQGFGPGTDVARLPFPVRDDYTSLMWLGGSSALFRLNEGSRASHLFWLYGNGARTPQTRAKGFYWAGRALGRGAVSAEALRLFEAAAQYPDQFYGQLALERLGRPLPSLTDPAHPAPTPQSRSQFLARPLTQAVREVARDADWQTTIRFFREISNQAQTEQDCVILTDYARQLGRRDLGVVAGQACANSGWQGFRSAGFPLIPIPAGADWTVIHAISRQESQFSQNAISRAGARGLMQLMPGTAGDVARKNGIPGYSQGGLTADPALNMRLGDTLFSHLMSVYNGSWPLAVAAYNAGPGNVNRWLAQNGDPRAGGIDWVEWIERIPITETRGYVQHVLENAVDYEALYPDHAKYHGPNPLSHFLGKLNPG